MMSASIALKFQLYMAVGVALLPTEVQLLQTVLFEGLWDRLLM